MPELTDVMGIGSWIVMGLVAGAVGKFLLPGRDAGGCIVTVLVGIAGALLGGFVATYLGFGGISGFDVCSLVIATLGAMLLLMALRILGFGGEKDKD